MDIRISGHQVETGSALQEHAQERLTSIVDKYFERAISSHVTFGKGSAHGFKCDIVTHAMQGFVIKAQAEAAEAHQALDGAAAKIDKQLRRYKRRIKDRHEQAAHAMKEEEAAYTIFAVDESEEEVTVDAPPIIAETSVYVPETTVPDAVMLLDLQDTPALFFKNAGTGRHNMVYRRADGSIGWVEPQ